MKSACISGRWILRLLPIGAYEPRQIMRAQHVNPEEAVRIFKHGGTQGLGGALGDFHPDR
jgi:hypothetical protein